MLDFIKYFYPDEKATDAPAFPNRHPKRKKDTQAGQFAVCSAWVSFFTVSDIFFDNLSAAPSGNLLHLEESAEQTGIRPVSSATERQHSDRQSP